MPFSKTISFIFPCKWTDFKTTPLSRLPLLDFCIPILKDEFHCIATEESFAFPCMSVISWTPNISVYVSLLFFTWLMILNALFPFQGTDFINTSLNSQVRIKKGWGTD